MRPKQIPDNLMEIVDDSINDNIRGTAILAGDNIIPDGTRDDTLISFSGTMRRRGMDADEIYPALKAINEKRCSPKFTEQEVRGVAESIMRYDPSSYGLTDVGNSKSFVDLNSHRIRYCSLNKKWFIWNGKFWEEVDSHQIVRCAQTTVEVMRDTASQIQNSDIQKKVKAHTIKSEYIGRLRAMVELAKPDLSVGVNDFDKDPWLLNCLNGTINLRSGDLQQQNPGDLITKMVQIEYDPDAECPEWVAFLNRVLRESPDLILFVQRAIGYCLTGDISEQVFFLLIGLGANGKSTFLSIVLKLIEDYGKQSDFNTFLHKNQSSIRNDLARLKGARLVCATEVDVGKRLSESVIKQVTGGDRITARFLFKEFFEFQPTFKIFLAANHKPTIRGTEHAIWRRIRLIPFSVTIPESERDPRLLDSLSEELPGILAWAVSGCLDWQESGLGYPQEVEQATTEYREDMDIVGGFLADDYIVEPGNNDLCILVNRLYQLYEIWCDVNSEERIKKHLFSKLIQEHGLIKRRSTADPHRGRYHWFGICEAPLQPEEGVGVEDLSNLL